MATRTKRKAPARKAVAKATFSSMTPQKRHKYWRFWIGLTLVTLVFLYLVKGILLPFVVGIMVAYFFDPLADKLEKYGISRGIATLIITVSFFLMVVGAIAVFFPLIYDDLSQLLQTLPMLLTEHQHRLLPLVNSWLHKIDPGISIKLTDSLKNASVAMLGYMLEFIGGVMQSGLALVNLMSLLFVTPVVTFYCLRDWDKMVAKLHGYLPEKQAPIIREQLAQMDRTLSGYIRGQTNVCLLLGIFYAIGLSAVGLEGGILIGFFTGIATFIPYVGMLIGTALGLITAWFQFESWEGVLTVACIFAIGQVIEGNFVAPKLVGDKVGLHPVWLIFGMLAGGRLFGLLGVILAVPATAVIGVLIRFLMGLYLDSRFYKT